MHKIFDYKCQSCGTVDEKIVKDDKEIICKCSGIMVRLPSAPGMVKSNFHDSTKFRRK